MDRIYTYDCDGCGTDVRNPHEVVLVLCSGCNGGQQVPSADPAGEYAAWLERVSRPIPETRWRQWTREHQNAKAISASPRS